MDKNEKIFKIRELEHEIEQKRLKIRKEESELRELEERYYKEQTSELPILLFQIDESLPMPDDRNDYTFEYVYYCPDIDEKKYFVRHSNNIFLPNTVDLRDEFSDFGVPRKSYSVTAIDYSAEVDMAVSILKSQIENLFETNEINSWEDVRSLMESRPSQKRNIKF